MTRYAFLIEYNGQPFCGWQRQPDQLSVQGAIESALARIDDRFGVTSHIIGAGRTDTGVHATGQVAHATLDRTWRLDRLRDALNHYLRPHPISIRQAAEVPNDFHARFSATERRYTFVLLGRRVPAVLRSGLVWQVHFPLDADAMRTAAAHLVGHHDFTTFRSSACQATTPFKTLDGIRIEQIETTVGQEFHIHLWARSFLHNQVRSIVGSLERVGAGHWPADRMAEALAAKDRSACGPVSPPDGLYLTDVCYPVNPFEVEQPKLRQIDRTKRP